MFIRHFIDSVRTPTFRNCYSKKKKRDIEERQQQWFLLSPCKNSRPLSSSTEDMTCAASASPQRPTPQRPAPQRRPPGPVAEERLSRGGSFNARCPRESTVKRGMKGRAPHMVLIYGSRTIFDIHFRRRCGQLEKQPTNSPVLTHRPSVVFHCVSVRVHACKIVCIKACVRQTYFKIVLGLFQSNSPQMLQNCQTHISNY